MLTEVVKDMALPNFESKALAKAVTPEDDSFAEVLSMPAGYKPLIEGTIIKANYRTMCEQFPEEKKLPGTLQSITATIDRATMDRTKAAGKKAYLLVQKGGKSTDPVLLIEEINTVSQTVQMDKYWKEIKDSKVLFVSFAIATDGDPKTKTFSADFERQRVSQIVEVKPKEVPCSR